MATATEIQTKTAKYLLNVDRIDAIVNGPVAGAASLVGLDNGSAKTLRRILSEMGVSGGLTAPDYSSGTAYNKGDLVYYNGHVYEALQDVPAGVSPENATYWKLIGEGSSIVDVVSNIGLNLQGAQEATADALSAATEAQALALQEAVDRQAEVSTIQANLQAQIDGQAAQIAALNDTPDYDPDTAYTTDEIVKYEGALYKAIQDVPAGHLPTETDYWLKIGDYASLGDAVVALTADVSDLESSITTLNSQLTAEISSRQSLAAQLRGSYTGTDPSALSQGLVYNERVARVSGDSANASSITALSSTVTALQGTVSGNSTAITSLQTTVSSHGTSITANSDAITSLQSSVAGKADASAVSALTTRVTTAEGNISSLSTSLTNLTSTVSGKADASALSALTTRVTTAEGNITSLTTSVTNLTSLLSGKADASALSTLSARVTTAEGNITSQSNQIINLQNSLTDSGSDNLLYNPSFDDGTGVALGWSSVMSSGAAATFAVISSLINNGKMQRIIGTSISDSAYAEVRQLVNLSAAPGRAVTLSVWGYAQANRVIYLRVLPVDATGTSTGSSVIAQATATGSWNRYTVTHPSLPAGTTAVYCQIRLYGTTSVLSGTMYLDNAQLEYGIAATSWRDNILATSEAVTSLTSSVTSQGDTITSLSSSLSSLSSTVGSHTASISTLSSTQASQGSALASMSTLLMVGGKVSGTISQNNGSISSFNVLADIFSVSSSGSGARTEFSGGNWRVYDTAGILRVRMGVW